MARCSATKLHNGKQAQLSGYIRGGTVGGFEIDARERSFPRTDHRVKSWFGRRHEGVIRAVEQLNSIATATELLARGTCKRSRCYGPRNPFPRVCESPLLRVVFLRVVAFYTCVAQSEGQFVFQGVTPAAHCRFDIVADTIFIHLLSFRLCLFPISPLLSGKFHRAVVANRETDFLQ